MIRFPLPLLRTLAVLSALAAVPGPLHAGDGALDTSYNANVNNDVEFLAVQPDGKALISGMFRSVGGASRAGVARINTDGTLDTGFDTDAAAGRGPVVVQTDGKIVATGSGDYVRRFNADGSADTAFNANATGTSGDLHALAIQPDGKILVGGDFNAVGSSFFTDGVMRLNADGTLDTTFVSRAGFYSVKAIVLLADGSFYAAGGNGSGSAAHPVEMAHLSAGGALLASYDATFDAARDSSAEISSLALQPDGKLLVSGRFITLQGVARPGVARLNTDGSVDASFDPGTGPANFNTVNALVLQADGKVIVGGGFTSFNGTPRNRVARLNADGSVDPSFDSGAGAGSSSGEFNGVLALALQADGALLAGGDFTLFGGVPRVALARLSNSGGGVVTPPPTGKQPDVSGTVDGLVIKLNKKGTKTIIKGKLTLTNGGKKGAKGIVVNVYLSDDGTLDPARDTLLGGFLASDYGYATLPKHLTVGPLAFRVPGAASLAQALHGKYVIVRIDVQGQPADGDLTNNVIVTGPLP